MPDSRGHDEVYCPDCGLQWVADEGVHTRGCRHLDLAKRPTDMDGEELRRLVLWLVDGGDRRMAPSEPDWSAEDYSAVRAVLGGLVDDCQNQFVALPKRANAPSR